MAIRQRMSGNEAAALAMKQIHPDVRLNYPLQLFIHAPTPIENAQPFDLDNYYNKYG